MVVLGKTYTANAMRPLPGFLLLCASYGVTAIAKSLLTEKGFEPCLAHAPGGRRGPVPRALVSGWCAVLAVVPLRSPSPGAVCRTPACHECEPLAVRTPACGFEWRAIPLAGWLSGFEPSHIGCRGVPRGGWVGGKPSLPGAACSALGGSGGAPRVVLLGRGSSFPLPPRKARDTHTRQFAPVSILCAVSESCLFKFFSSTSMR